MVDIVSVRAICAQSPGKSCETARRHTTWVVLIIETVALLYKSTAGLNRILFTILLRYEGEIVKFNRVLKPLNNKLAFSSF